MDVVIYKCRITSKWVTVVSNGVEFVDPTREDAIETVELMADAQDVDFDEYI